MGDIDMDDPSKPARPLATGRREVIRGLVGLGVGGIALASPSGNAFLRRMLGGEALAQACDLSSELTEGPFYLADRPLRRNVVEDRPGIVLWLSLTVLDAQTCAPIPGATVDIWHADAAGSYSGFEGEENDTFLRGRLTAGAAGVATFRTVYPGWYTGRTPHIHVKVEVGGNDVHTGQVFFDEGVTAAVYAREPYVTRGTQDTTNAEDGIFAGGGAESVLVPVPRGKGYWAKGSLVVAV
jgi:hypothetical protein